jgi:uncharacterized protein YndB with AHSA1/START domain
MTDEVPSTEVSAEGITLTRIFDAPRELVWQAWTDPAHFAQWFGEYDSTIPLETASMDVRPGGEWRVIMHVPTEGEIPFSGVYREVVEPERLVLTLRIPDGSGNEEVLTVVLTEFGDGRTHQHFTQRGGNLSEEEYGQAAGGTSIFFERLAAHVAGS